MRPARARKESGLTLTPVPPKELVQPAAVHAVQPRELADRPTLAQVRLDQVPPDVHPETSSPHVSDVLTHPSPRCRLSPDLAHPPGYRSRVQGSETMRNALVESVFTPFGIPARSHARANPRVPAASRRARRAAPTRTALAPACGVGGLARQHAPRCAPLDPCAGGGDGAI